MLRDDPVPEIPIDRFSIFADGLDHPECCAFARDGSLWAGGEAGQIYRIDAEGNVAQVANLGRFCGGLAFSPSDELFACVPGLGVVQVARSGESKVFRDAAAGRELICPNFPVFDRAGNLYLSDSGDWKGRNGRLVRIGADGRDIELISSFGYANGLALTADEKYLFIVESDSDAVFRLQLDGNGAAAGEPELYCGPIGHVPDGLNLDIDGNLYVTCYASHEIYRVAPNREVVLLARDVNGMLLGGPTNMCFGGSDYREIFVSNLCRFTISRAAAGRTGLRPVNLR
ncbi:MAG: SMP-30/gluconolactonase/LRE family protein [Bryobacteraceae bacterium]|nr:SMP-30/gluconolactonase/LRE family protein [Bryobacteraceae bacterium]